MRQLLESVRRAHSWLTHTYEGKNTHEFQSEAVMKNRRRGLRFVYHLTFSLLLALILVWPEPNRRTIPNYRLGDTADVDVISPFSGDIEFKEPSPTLKASLEKKVAPVFDYDDAAVENWVQRWEHTFRILRKEFYLTKRRQTKTPEELDLIARRVQELAEQRLSLKDLSFLHQNQFSEDTEKLFMQMARQLSDRLIAPTDLFSSYYRTGIVVRQINQDLNETLVYDLSRIWSLEQVREYLSHIPDLLEERQVQKARRISELLKHVIIANLKFNPARTQVRISAILGMTQASVQSVKKGQTVVRRGERINEHQIELLSHLKTLTSKRTRWIQFGFATFIILIFLYVLLGIEVARRKTWRRSLKDSIVFLLVTLMNVAIIKFTFPFVKTGFYSFGIRLGIEYFFPISFGALLIHLMIGKQAAFLLSMLVSLCMGYILDKDYFVSLWAFTVMACAVQSIKSCKQRTDLYRCGLISGGISSVFATTLFIFSRSGFQNHDWIATITVSGFSFFAAFASPILTGAFIPLWEALFGYTTSLKLLELSNFNHPLLHTLMMKAPGTYHHSVIVGSLAEVAADRVRANGLLARVSAYYHDIGKMSKPLYFIENQSPNENPHDALQPNMSAKILFSHVKIGVKMAHEHSLGENITNIIEQHHGTTLVHYFFNRAKQTEKAETGTVQESDFRYPGPKPQSREAAIVMLADACEAATRSINDPTPAKIQGMVQSIINRRILDQQFNECDLNFNDLQIIAECFTRTLVSLYHHRIEYPAQKAPPALPIEAAKSLKQFG